MYSGMAATSPAAALWFVAVIIIGNYVLLNLFLAVLLENFGASAAMDAGNASSKSTGGSNGSTLAAAAQAAVVLSWMKELLESSWVAKLVNGRNAATIHPGIASSASDDWSSTLGSSQNGNARLGGWQQAHSDDMKVTGGSSLSAQLASADAAAGSDPTVHLASLCTTSAVHPGIAAVMEREGVASTMHRSFSAGMNGGLLEPRR